MLPGFKFLTWKKMRGKFREFNTPQMTGHPELRQDPYCFLSNYTPLGAKWVKFRANFGAEAQKSRNNLPDSY